MTPERLHRPHAARRARMRAGVAALVGALVGAAGLVLATPSARATPTDRAARLRDVVPADAVAVAHAPSLAHLAALFTGKDERGGAVSSAALQLALDSPLGVDLVREAAHIGLADGFGAQLAKLPGPAVLWIESSPGGALLLAISSESVITGGPAADGAVFEIRAVLTRRP